ncbi:hypothetical protein ACT6QG_12040 [Xanthobacter sp. TB0136]|uniref:hypothetical protein n=1 Tax=Xanthobacter sp. TB0136 TaxID=3459177 RepID=UPI0040390235
MDRDRQIELMTGAQKRLSGHVRAWTRDPEINAALRRKPAKTDNPSSGGEQPDKARLKSACG